MRRRTRVRIDYSRCGDGRGVDPRSCCVCLRVCEPAVFLLHETVGARQPDPFDPQLWRVTPLWQSLCTGCLKCVQLCPKTAITVRHSA
ncbi:MAG: 4Fe-4S binding protein [Spirochaetia bacterium]